MFGRKPKAKSLDICSDTTYLIRPGYTPTRGELFLLNNLIDANRTPWFTRIVGFGSIIVAFSGAMFFLFGGAVYIMDGFTGYSIVLSLAGLGVGIVGTGIAYGVTYLENMKTKLLEGVNFVLRRKVFQYNGYSATSVSTGRYHTYSLDLIDKAILTAESLDSALSADTVRELVKLRWSLASLEREHKIVDEVEVDSMSRNDKKLRDVTLGKISYAHALLTQTAEGIIEEVNKAAEANLDSRQSLERKRMLAISAHAEQLCEPDPDAQAQVLLQTYTEALKASESDYLAISS